MVDPNAELPIDSDTATARPGRAPHLRPAYLGLVLVGGMAGTAVRAGISLVVEPIGSFPLAIFVINIVGAFVLGVLLEALALRGPDVGRRRALRLLFGTGVLGGFTTYSALASDSAVLLTDGGIPLALLYGLATVLLGALASWAGILLGARLGPRPPHPASASTPPGVGSASTPPGFESASTPPGVGSASTPPGVAPDPTPPATTGGAPEGGAP